MINYCLRTYITYLIEIGHIRGYLPFPNSLFLFFRPTVTDQSTNSCAFVSLGLKELMSPATMVEVTSVSSITEFVLCGQNMLISIYV